MVCMTSHRTPPTIFFNQLSFTPLLCMTSGRTSFPRFLKSGLYPMLCMTSSNPPFSTSINETFPMLCMTSYRNPPSPYISINLALTPCCAWHHIRFPLPPSISITCSIPTDFLLCCAWQHAVSLPIFYHAELDNMQFPSQPFAMLCMKPCSTHPDFFLDVHDNMQNSSRPFPMLHMTPCSTHPNLLLCCAWQLTVPLQPFAMTTPRDFFHAVHDNTQDPFFPLLSMGLIPMMCMTCRTPAPFATINVLTKITWVVCHLESWKVWVVWIYNLHTFPEDLAMSSGVFML
jgi:hypothetical protein